MAGTRRQDRKATPKRRGIAREKGQVARSTDPTHAGVLLAGLFGVMLMAPKVLAATASAMTDIFGEISRPQNAHLRCRTARAAHPTEETPMKTVRSDCRHAASAPGLSSTCCRSGIRFTPKAVRPSFGVLNPIHGLKNLFSIQSTFTLAKSLVKMAIVGGLVALALMPDLTKMGAAVGTTPYGLVF